MTTLERIKQWLSTVVIGLNFCPFARVPFQQEQIRFVIEKEENLEAIAKTCLQEWQLLKETTTIETTLLILEVALTDFETYLNFVAFLEELLVEAGYEGIIQIATFHPDYQFADTNKEAVSNFTNRSPFPILHFLKEESVSWAVDQHPNTTNIPAQNIARLEALGIEEIKKIWNDFS